MIWKRLSLLLGSVLVSLVISEIVLRSCVARDAFLEHAPDESWTVRLKSKTREESPHVDGRYGDVQLDPGLGWRMIPHHRSDGYTTNSRGYRGSAEYALGRRENGRRMVVIGDSFTQGFKVRDDETYCARMREHRPDVEILNLGVNAYGTDQQLLLWKEEGILYEPDVVLLGFYLPDFHRNALRVREFPKPCFELDGEELRLTGTPVPPPEEVLEAYAAERRTRLRWLDVVRSVTHRARERVRPRSFERKSALTSAIVRELNRSVKEIGARLAIVLIPYRRIGERESDRQIVALLTDVTAREGIPCLDLTEPLLEVAAETPDVVLYDPGHAHWTPPGHAIAAEHIVRFLEEVGAL